MDDIKNDYAILNVIDDIEGSKSYIDYKNYHMNNIFGIAGVSRWELVHSNFIAWMLDPKSSHGLGHYPLLNFIKGLKRVKQKEENKKEGDKEPRFDENIVLKFYEADFITGADVEKEKDATVEEKKNRIDIHIKVYTKEKTLPIIIENKVDSKENGKNHDQTEEYFKWGETEYNNKKEYYPPIYIFLVPEYKKNVKPKNDNYLQMTYQDLVDSVLDPALRKCKDNTAKRNIEMYLQCLSYQTDNEKGEGTMAISDGEKKILESFLKENGVLFRTIIDMLVEKGDLDADVANIMNDQISGSKSNFKFNGKTCNVRGLALAIVKEYIDEQKKEGKQITFSELQQAFPKELQGSYGVVARESDVTEKDKGKENDSVKRYFVNPEDKIKLIDKNNNETIVLVSNQWGAGKKLNNIEKLINRAKELGIITSDNFGRLNGEA